LNSRIGFAGVAFLMGGTSYFLGMGLAQDARMKGQRDEFVRQEIERKAEAKLRQVEKLSSTAAKT